MGLSKAVWRKASKSHDDGDQCIEVASTAETIAVRDSKDPHGPKLVVSRRNFRRFAEVIKDLWRPGRTIACQSMCERILDGSGELMGKHGKQVSCGMCNGSGKIVTTDDNKRREIPCAGCGGTGKIG